jgi:hypothetical protein
MLQDPDDTPTIISHNGVMYLRIDTVVDDFNRLGRLKKPQSDPESKAHTPRAGPIPAAGMRSQ